MVGDLVLTCSSRRLESAQPVFGDFWLFALLETLVALVCRADDSAVNGPGVEYLISRPTSDEALDLVECLELSANSSSTCSSGVSVKLSIHKTSH